MNRPGPKQGFTLIESIVALAIAAAGFASLYQLYATTANAERAATETVYAARLAESLLADPEADPDGDSRGYAWVIASSPSPGGAALETLTVTITAPSGRQIRVVTERASPPRETP
ncbi:MULTISPECIES: prepilin-type N-terminal cleavage/methylation domain-containing protein [Hyphobacterium]|uniref:Prepilin-type N-terminal cleavage/methylation domain-containing protein n=1 Tax=Hyphobacterium vulgare TaxID=1736751 RepID=A0ABV6ZVG0_9PROT